MISFEPVPRIRYSGQVQPVGQGFPQVKGATVGVKMCVGQWPFVSLPARLTTGLADFRSRRA